LQKKVSLQNSTNPPIFTRYFKHWKEKKLVIPKKEEPQEKKSFSIREMEIGDLGEVYQLGELSFRASLWPMLYRSWDEYEVTTLFNTDGEYCLVAENDNENAPKGERIVGFILGTVVSKPGSAWSYGYIIWLCSHSGWGRAGVASELVDELVKIMVENEGIRIMMADTDPDNESAVRFFTKKGLIDQKPHLYMSSNLEQNPHYQGLLKQYRAENSTEAEKAKRKVRKLLLEKKRLEYAKKKKNATTEQKEPRPSTSKIAKSSPQKKKNLRKKKKKKNKKKTGG
jgi:ribosomal protein S18 acetylase RimI-like enzyme